MSPILDLPFHSRRYISVVSNEQFDSSKECAKPQPEANNRNAGSYLLPAVSLIAPALVPGGLLVRGLLLAGTVAYTAYATSSSATKDDSAPSPNSDLIIEIPVRETESLSFSTKYAEVGRIYAANPLESLRYYPVETYNDDLIIHKLSELELILSALGAKQFDIKYHEDAIDNASAKIDVSSIPIGGRVEASKARRRRFERSGTSVGRDPVLPDNLTWYDHEPEWQALAKSRMHYGRKEFSFSVELEKGFELTATAIAAFKSLGFEFGAEYNQSRNLTLLVSGTF